MATATVHFAIKDKLFPREYDRERLKLGAIVHVAGAESDLQFSPDAKAGSTPYAVRWIAPSNWYVELTDGTKIGDAHVDRIVKAVDGLVEEAIIRKAIERCCAEIRPEKMYLTAERERSRLHQIQTVVDRLDLVDRLCEEAVARQLFSHWEPLVIYLLLTCFDRLGQPADWLPFPSWLDRAASSGARPLVDGEDAVSTAKRVYSEYAATYGVKSSFYRFLNSVLPKGELLRLLWSFDIRILMNPPHIETRMANADEKLERLYEIRNRYTHRALYVSGGSRILFGTENEVAVTTMGRDQKFDKREWSDLETRDWPSVFVSTVRSGLAALIADIAAEKSVSK